MKKIVYSLVVMFISLVFIPEVNASVEGILLTGESTFDNEITLNVEVQSFSELNGVCGIVGELDYDSSKLELTSIEGLDDFDLTYNEKINKIVLFQATCVNNETKILTMNFKNLSLEKEEITSVSLKNIIASDGKTEVNLTDTSKTIKLVEKEENRNNEISNDEVTGSNNKDNNLSKEKEEQITEMLKEEKSTNNYLSSIQLSDGKITFSKDTLTYDVIVGYDVKLIEINATAEDEKAKIMGIGKHNLKVGRNTITLTVEAEDGTKRAYTINVNREEKGIIVDNDESNNKDNNNIIIYVVSGVVLVAIIGIAYFVNNNRKKVTHGR